MTYPNIHPIEPDNKDGWGIFFNTDTRRLLHLCGLKPTRNTGGKVTWENEPSKFVPDWVVSQETRPIKVTFTSVRNILRKVGLRFGVRPVCDILRVHANCTTLATLKSRDYRNVYVACQAKLNDGPPALEPPSKKPYA